MSLEAFLVPRDFDRLVSKKLDRGYFRLYRRHRQSAAIVHHSAVMAAPGAGLRVYDCE